MGCGSLLVKSAGVSVSAVYLGAQVEVEVEVEDERLDCSGNRNTDLDVQRALVRLLREPTR